MKHILFILCSFIPLAVFSQACQCDTSREVIFVHSTLNLCGEVYDSASQEKLIGEFRLCNKDSVVIDQLTNKAASYLFKTLPNGISLVSIDLKIEKGKLIYPQNFTKTIILLVRNKLTILTTQSPAKPIVLHLQRDFKKFRELY